MEASCENCNKETKLNFSCICKKVSISFVKIRYSTVVNIVKIGIDLTTKIDVKEQEKKRKKI